ncbi:MFS transporter [Peribacillus frigoritolerans]|nr:MFS transporter [Peribacillus frigoritolerans]
MSGLFLLQKSFISLRPQTGILISIFFVSYSLMQPLGGWMTDKYGARVMVTVSLFSWSLFTVMTGFAWSFMSLLFIRFLFGLGEGPFYPASMSTIRDNFPEEERGRANSFFLSAQNIGGILGYCTCCFHGGGIRLAGHVYHCRNSRDIGFFRNLVHPQASRKSRG